MIDAQGIIYVGQLGKYNEEGPKPTALGTRLRVSDAGSCERQRWYKASGFEECETPDLQTLLAFHVGNSIHDFVQEAFVRQAKAGGVSVDVEVPVDCRPLGVDMSGSADLVVTYQDGHKVVVEFKSASAYGSKLAKEAPKREHVAQAGLYARGLGANAIHIVYVAKESSFRDKVRAGDVYEHYFELGDTVFDDESVNEVVEFELIRFRRVEAALNENVLPYPVVYDESYGDNNWSRLKTVEEPGPYGVGSKKLHWECRYCLYNGLCHGVGPDEVQL
jgi:hypothetical protein